MRRASSKATIIGGACMLLVQMLLQPCAQTHL
jgi:hypothetical protein